jgi:hypothetical protein
MAHHVGQALLAHGDAPFTADWMRQTFDGFWNSDAQYITGFTNMLLQPPPPHVQQYLGAATQVPALADAFFDNFGEPQRFWPWITSPEQTAAVIQKASTAAA